MLSKLGIRNMHTPLLLLTLTSRKRITRRAPINDPGQSMLSLSYFLIILQLSLTNNIRRRMIRIRLRPSNTKQTNTLGPYTKHTLLHHRHPTHRDVSITMRQSLLVQRTERTTVPSLRTFGNQGGNLPVRRHLGTHRISTEHRRRNRRLIINLMRQMELTNSIQHGTGIP